MADGASPRGTMTVIAEALAPLAGRHVLDVGCGPGSLARALLKRGARVTGIDPDAAAIAEARQRVPEAVFEVASAAALPFAAAAFDGAVLLNSLHHIPAAAMEAALAETARTVGPGRTVVVVEPLARGSFHEAFRAIEDETAVRAEAAAALERAVASGTFRVLSDETYDRAEIYADLDAMLAATVGDDPERQAAATANRAEIKAAFHRLAERTPDGRYAFVQPMRAVILRVT